MNKLNLWLKRHFLQFLWAAGILNLLAIVFSHMESFEMLANVLFLIAFALSGLPILFRAIQALRFKTVSIELLVSIAAIGACLIGEFNESAIVTFLFQLGSFLEQKTMKKTRSAIKALTEMAPQTAYKILSAQEDGGFEIEEIEADEVEIGDLLLVKAGNQIASDGIVIKGQGYAMEASITGESLPKKKKVGDFVYAGTILDSGILQMQATKVGEDTTFAKIIALVEEAQDAKSPAERFIDKFAKYYTPAVIVIAILVFILTRNVDTAITVLVLACPGALVIGAPIANVAGIGRGAQNDILLKGGDSIDRFSKTDTIVFDKTGTLTTGKFEVTDVSPVQGSREELLELAALGEHNSNHPIAQSAKQAYGKEADTGRIGRVEEISGHGIHAQVQINGEWKEIYIGNQKLMDRQGVTVSTPAAVLGTTLYLAEGTTYLGSIVISDSVRPDVPAMLAGLKKQGVSRLVMLTGDKEEVGKKVAESIGITHVFGNLLPGDKVAKVEQLLAEKPEGKTLAFVGDGINDAPVLARADVGIAMGGIGSDAAVEAADVVIMDDEPSKIVDAICIARKTVRIVKQNIIFAIAVKIAVLILVAFGCATMWAAVFGDVGVSVLAILNAIRALSYKK